jgi:Myb/SANT-like DNA-binding domain
MSEDKERATWTDAQRHKLLSLLHNAAQNGKTADSGFKAETWATVKTTFNAEMKTTYSVNQLKTQWKALKARYQVFHRLVTVASGFGWDPVTDTVTAEDAVWEIHLAQFPAAKQFRTGGFKFYTILDALCNGRIATGDYALSLTDENGIY